MNKKYDVIALGELLVDMIDHGRTERGNTLFEANPGGAPCNALAMLRQLNRKVGFIGKVGDDLLGHELKETLDKLGINSENLIMDPYYRTTLAFVKNFEDGDRDFSFYRNPGADMMLTKNEIPVDVIRNTKIFHYGTISMTHHEVREATYYAIDEAKKSGAITSFDPNIRETLWNDLNDAKEQLEKGLEKCDVLKISDNEILWFTGENDYSRAVEKIREKYSIPLITVSLGKMGSRAYYRSPDNGKENIVVEEKPFLQEDTIETTGAGDTFCGCVLNFVLENGLYNVNESKLRSMLRFANCAASIVTTRRGALKVMPTREEIIHRMV